MPISFNSVFLSETCLVPGSIQFRGRERGGGGVEGRGMGGGGVEGRGIGWNGRDVGIPVDTVITIISMERLIFMLIRNTFVP